MGWNNASPQAKVFAVTHAAATLIEFLAETSLYGLIPDEAGTATKTRFWSQYVMGLGFNLIMGAIGYAATDCLARSGWTKTAWVMAVLPTLMLLTGGFLLHGVDTVLGTSSGTGSVTLLKAAYSAKKKSVKST